MPSIRHDLHSSKRCALALSRGLAAAVLMTGCAGCGAPEMVGVHFGGDLAPSDWAYPERNPHPARRILIDGIVSPALQPRLFAHYQTDGRFGCQSAPSFIAGAVEGAVFPSSVSVPLELTRQAGRYAAVLETDAFQPGYCKWRFAYVSVELTKAGRTSLPNPIARVREGVYATRPDNAWGNGDATPVVLYCWFSRLRNDGPHLQSNACIEPPYWPHPGKREHYLTAQSRRFSADFIDEEADPLKP